MSSFQILILAIFIIFLLIAFISLINDLNFGIGYVLTKYENRPNGKLYKEIESLLFEELEHRDHVTFSYMRSTYKQILYNFELFIRIVDKNVSEEKLITNDFGWGDTLITLKMTTPY